jgi:hypothetical protein
VVSQVLFSRLKLLFQKPKRIWTTAFIFLIISLLDRYAPPRDLPWKPLNLDEPIGLATGIKVGILSLMPRNLCFEKLASAKQLNYKQVLPKIEGRCGWKTAATMLEVSNIKFKPKEVTAQCPVLLASYIWLKDIDKAAKKRLGSGLKYIYHAGTYSCRRQRGNSSGAWSEHAFASAWDITGFELNDGRVISVLKHWNKGTSKKNRAKAIFLRDTYNSACRVFRVVLSPDFNTAHQDHFHLDQGLGFSCH